MATVRVEVWSDVACPWCWVGKKRLDAAVRSAEGLTVEVEWRAFELDPSAPRHPPEVGYAERLARKYRTSLAEAEAMLRRMTDVGAGEGVAFRFDRVRPGNTFDAHRVIHLAATRGLGGAMKERLFRAYFDEGRAITEADTLAELAGDAGLGAEEVRSVLAGDALAAEVRRDEDRARELGISGVPFFLFERRYAVEGAQPAETLRHVLARVRELGGAAAAGASCGPDVC